MPLPPNSIVTYKARQTPSEPSSNVLMKHKVLISAQSQNGNDITWQIDKLKFSQSGVANWTDDNPGLSTWTVTHADPDNPVAADFTSPPRMSGTATLDGGPGDALTYSFVLGSCTVPEKSMYSGDVTCAAYSYAAAATIAEEDEDEPAETEFEIDPE